LLNVQQAVFQLCSGREQIQEIHYIEEFDDTKEVVRIRKSKNRQYNDQKDKQRSTKHTNKTKDRVTRTPLNTGGELRCFGRVSISCSTNGTRRVNLVTNPEIMRGGAERTGATTSDCHWKKNDPIFSIGFYEFRQIDYLVL
jgi:hypothetical protein